jgi:uncharacterized membrane protein
MISMKKKVWFYILMFLPLIVISISLIFLPDKIPAHYGIDGKVTRWGSKYEKLIFPMVTIPFGFFLLSMGKLASKEKNTNNEEVVIITGVMVLLVFNILTGYSLYTSFNKVEKLTDVVIDIRNLLFSALGVVLIVIGNVMPKCKRNSIIGLRTKWSLSSDKAWEKSQRFGGVSLIVVGALMLIGNSIIFKGNQVLVFSGVLILIDLIVSILYTYIVAKEE